MCTAQRWMTVRSVGRERKKEEKNETAEKLGGFEGVALIFSETMGFGRAELNTRHPGGPACLQQRCRTPAQDPCLCWKHEDVAVCQPVSLPQEG